MSGFPRYAVYFVPDADHALTQFGAETIGYDAFAGATVAFPPEIAVAIPDWRELTSDPRTYGFHATLKAPFALAPGTSEAELLDACAALAATPRQLPIIMPIIDQISGFIAITPSQPSAQLSALASDCVTALDRFRAPLTAADRARRRPDRLSPAQRENLDRWGYPHVMEDFRFHMTLTGRLGDDRRGPILGMLRDRFAALKIARLPIDRIGVFRQADAQARFTIAGHWPLTNGRQK